jgi:very-short-patch-repair endonuclease
MNETRVRARQLRKNPTDAERLLWRKLRFWQVDGLKFRRQQPLGRYIVDFICLEKSLVIEVDGGQHSEQVAYDVERDIWLRDQGFNVLRFWNHDVLKNMMESLTWLSKPCEVPPSLIRPRKGEGKRS